MLYLIGCFNYLLAVIIAITVIFIASKDLIFKVLEDFPQVIPLSEILLFEDDHTN